MWAVVCLSQLATISSEILRRDDSDLHAASFRAAAGKVLEAAWLDVWDQVVKHLLSNSVRNATRPFAFHRVESNSKCPIWALGCWASLSTALSIR